MRTPSDIKEVGQVGAVGAALSLLGLGCMIFALTTTDSFVLGSFFLGALFFISLGLLCIFAGLINYFELA
jgi:hypothetical protein